MTSSIILKKTLPVLAGALLGFAYWWFIGCASGACPITGNGYISTLYGALVGATFLLPSRRTAGKDSAPSATKQSDITKD